MKIKPLHDRVLIKRISEEEKTKGGIIIPDTAKEKPTMKCTTPLDLTFHEQTTTFDLTVTLNKKKLTIILNDYIDWIIY